MLLCTRKTTFYEHLRRLLHRLKSYMNFHLIDYPFKKIHLVGIGKEKKKKKSLESKNQLQKALKGKTWIFFF